MLETPITLKLAPLVLAGWLAVTSPIFSPISKYDIVREGVIDDKYSYTIVVTRDNLIREKRITDLETGEIIYQIGWTKLFKPTVHSDEQNQEKTNDIIKKIVEKEEIGIDKVRKENR